MPSSASGLPHYCTSICVRFGCTQRASCVDSKPKKKKKASISASCDKTQKKEIVGLHVFAYAFKSKVHCGSVLGPSRLPACELPYYCTPLVCVPAVIGALSVWRQNTKKIYIYIY